MPVYIIANADGLVKIGHAANPWKRLVGMQTAVPERLALLAIFDGGPDVEMGLHARFASARVRGEWFRRTPEIEALIQQNSGPQTWRRREPKSHPLERYRYRHRLVLRELTERTGIGEPMLAKIIGGKRGMSTATIRAIVLATDGEVTAEELVFWPDEAPASRERHSLYVVGALGEAA